MSILDWVFGPLPVSDRVAKIIDMIDRDLPFPPGLSVSLDQFQGGVYPPRVTMRDGHSYVHVPTNRTEDHLINKALWAKEARKNAAAIQRLENALAGKAVTTKEAETITPAMCAAGGSLIYDWEATASIERPENLAKRVFIAMVQAGKATGKL